MRKLARLVEPLSAEGGDFSKKDWVLAWKNLRKDYVVEDRERYRPLLNVKRDCKDFVEDTEKEEKKLEIALKKENAALLAVIGKHKSDVEQAKTLITSQPIDPAQLDRIHFKVKTIEGNLRQFKLRERQIYEQLVDEELALENELQMWADKFDAYAQEECPVTDIIQQKSTKA
jgi:predicted MPP superfamily phosphohydrolase